ncbi:cytochrome P450 [Aspergillus novofumigatus IBT 16806]|uniref:Cytochrome P450 n=1 Tax=Aspergillus novofumigatus (strain IBT 16806) TaxID=1392255 RepID=A0A2I1C160_ASPN1|nr:cytochrome P450 [Aspergillus novofumigatus IBT 16806]PKX91335.1 cytochrome P450 [Aspergillus novofumigatus IBT 16806]
MYTFITCLVLFTLLLQRWLKLRHLNGPWIARFTTLWQAIHILKGDLPEVVLELHKRHGPLVRVGPNHVSVADPAEIKNIYRLPKGTLYQMLIAYVKGKRIMGWEVLGFEPRIEETISEFETHLSRMRDVDITKWIPLFALDAINRIGFSHGAHMMKQVFLITVPTFGRALNYIVSYFINPRNGLVLRAESLAHARYHAAQKSDQNDLLGYFLEVFRRHPDLYSMDGVIDLTYTALLGVQDELDAAVAHGRLSYPPKWKDIRNLRYLDADIKEAMRYRTLTRFVIERQVGPHVYGQDIPPGTTVRCVQHVIHRNSSFGFDVHKFRPERWLECTDEERLVMERSILTFAYGAHNCVGQNILRLIIYKLLASLLLRIKLSATDPVAELSHIPMSAISISDRPFFVTVLERNTPDIV